MYKKKFTQISNLFGFKSKVASRSQSEIEAGKFQVIVGSASKATCGATGYQVESMRAYYFNAA
jgi:hypothetical protein